MYFFIGYEDPDCLTNFSFDNIVSRPKTIVPEESEARLYEDPQISLRPMIPDDLPSNNHHVRGQTSPNFKVAIGPEEIIVEHRRMPDLLRWPTFHIIRP